VKLTLQIKLLPTKEQEHSLINTIKEANKACNKISEIAWDKKEFKQFNLQKVTYHIIKDSFNLSAQNVIRCIKKVSDAYALDKKVKREFRPLGSIAYDSRILTYKPNDIVSIWTVDGRQKIPFICHNPKYIPYIKGESDLVFKKGKFYLFQTIEVPEEKIKDIEDFIGCDFGQTDIAVTSDGKKYSSENIKKVRKKYTKVRASVQSKGTKGAKRLLKRLSGREKRFVTITNHTISKNIVKQAKEEGKGVAVEDLTNIRKTAKSKSKQQKTELNKWSFFQLRQHLEYKCKLAGVKFVAVPPQYTSQTCSCCMNLGDRNGKKFSCKNCGNKMDADENAAKIIATWGRTVIRPENSMLYCDIFRHSCVRVKAPLL
jgi:IS605 OrfB family transposase